jgi:DNA-nicking Smr family endonuclease
VAEVGRDGAAIAGNGTRQRENATRPLMTGENPEPGDPVELPIDGVLDLHTFRPQDVKSVVEDYLKECRKRGICEVRVVHGKGIGNLRRTVHSILSKHPEVISFSQAGEAFGGWGATFVYLKPPRATR